MAGRKVSMWHWLALALAIVLVDQLTKWLIIGNYRLGDSTYVTSYFNIVRAHNTGAAFSFLASAGGWPRWFFIGLSAVVAVFVVHGYVVDFLDFHWSFLAGIFPGGHFPAFNVADMAITAGAVALILDEVLRVRRSK